MIKLLMKYRKQTKHTFVFEEVNDDGSERENMDCTIPTLYIRKRALKEPTQFIRVDVTLGKTD